MSYAPSKLVERAWATPPRCLESFVAAPVVEPPDGTFNELGYFALACTCGNDSFKVLGHPQEDELFAAPLGLTCTVCDKSAELFDIAAHGYDAELGHGCYSCRGTGAQSEYSCLACQSSAFGAQAGFSYQIEPIEDFGPENQDRIQDLFDWFYLDVRCKNCGEAAGVSDYECA